MFMFNSRNLLVGLVAASVSFGVGNDGMAIAQNAPKSTRYVSDQEIQFLRAESLARVAGGSRFFQEQRSPSETHSLKIGAWRKSD